MAKMANIDPLAFHNYTVGSDSIKCKYDDAEAGKEGEKLTKKNINTNPFNWKACWWTQTAINCSIESIGLAISEKILLTTRYKRRISISKVPRVINIIIEN